MNLSLKNRVALSFIFANIVIIILAFLVFYFLNSLNKEFELITVHSNQTAFITDEARISTIDILKGQRKMMTSQDDTIREKIIGLCESLSSQVSRLELLYENPDAKKNLTQMSSYADSLRLILSSKENFTKKDMVQDFSSVNDLTDKILETYSAFSNIQLVENRNRRQKYETVLKEIKKTMMITLIIGLLGTIILGLIVPGKIALPFKKIKDAIRELQNSNFDVSIYYNQNDEIGEIAQEMNIMINSIKIFEELRADKVSIEKRKFDALANMVKKPILVANAEGELIYMNNHLYSLLQCQSEEVLGRPMKETVIPKSIIHCYELAIKRRSKIENEEVFIPKKVEELIDNGENEDQKEINELSYFNYNAEETLKNAENTKEESRPGEDHEVELIFKGYANVIPIRGKKSSLDYYLMILSKKVIV